MHRPSGQTGYGGNEKTGDQAELTVSDLTAQRKANLCPETGGNLP
jgi:hypothetical protein